MAYGSYRHDDNECEVIRTRASTFNPAGQTLTVKRVWQINGQLQAASSSALITEIADLERAYSLPFKDVVLYLSDGSTVFDALRNIGSLTGVIVESGPDYPVGRGAEGQTFLNYAIRLSAEYVFSRSGGTGSGSGQPGDTSRLSSWSESVSVVGGGARYAVVETVDGDPVRQQINARTKVRITQRGTATGMFGFPSPPPPLYPDAENEAERDVQQQAQSSGGPGQGTGYTVTWAYVMEGSGIGGAEPNPWPF